MSEADTNSQQVGVVPSEASAEEVLPKWQCELQAIPGGPELAKWEVGDKYFMVCKGDVLPEAFKPSVKTVFKEEEGAHTLDILSVNQSDQQQATFVITGYKPGKYDQRSFQLSDGVIKAEVQGLSWEVNSVIAGKNAQAYGSVGPEALVYPVWFGGGIIFIVAALLLVVVLFLKKRLERKRLYERLAKQRTALGPYNQLNKDMRILIRKYSGRKFNSVQEENVQAAEYLQHLSEVFKLYLVRQLLVPANEWGIRKTMKEIKTYHRRLYKENGEQIERLLRELDKAQKNIQQVKMVDCEQLANMARHTAARIHLRTGTKAI